MSLFLESSLSSIVPAGLDTSPIPLSPAQSQALSLLSQIEDTRIRLALLESLDSQSLSEAGRRQEDEDEDEDEKNEREEIMQAQLRQAELALLESRARYTLRNRIIDQVLVADPILQAIHDPDAHLHEEHTQPERPKSQAETEIDSASASLLHQLRRAIHTRDALDMLHADTAAKVAAAEQRSFTTERETKQMNEQSAQLARRMVALALELDDDSSETVQDERIRSQLLEIDRDLAGRRKEWRQLKSFLGSIIVASGVDWASDTSLVELVMDDEQDDKP